MPARSTIGRSRTNETVTAASTVRQCIRLLSVPSVYAPHSRAGNLTGIGRSTFYELIEAGVFETVKVGRSPSSELPASSASSRRVRELLLPFDHHREIGRESCRENVCQYV